ncbi:MAG: TIGR02646 family protein [Chloroflexota bacterium]|nr:TIGR02646 family protein [Chloroflexota bacterium]
MHSVPRSPEPDYWEQLKTKYQRWEDLEGLDRVQIRDSLVEDFGPICAYCERPCMSPTPTHDSPDEETIDHFRPRSRFHHLSFDWLNLIYACQRCNQSKNNQWPGFDDDVTNQWLAAAYPGRYMAPPEYVNPNATDDRRLAQEFFTYDFDTGEMLPAEELDPAEWSMAVRTIRDIDLNDNDANAPGEYDPGHLWNRRLAHLNILLSQLLQINDTSRLIDLIGQFALPDKPFSGFIVAYAKELGLDI